MNATGGPEAGHHHHVELLDPSTPSGCDRLEELHTASGGNCQPWQLAWVGTGGTDLLLFRLAPAPGPPTARSPRYPVERVLELG